VTGRGTPAFAVGFDFDHTLGLDNGLETTAFYRLGADLGHSLSERDRMWAVAIADLLERFRTAVISLDAAVAEFVEHLGKSYRPEHALRYRAICYGLVDELVTPIEGARDVLTALSERGVPTAILTNGWSPLQQRKIARALGYGGPILVSDELGILKPAPAAFGKLVEVLGVAPERVWFVGDNPLTDIAGSQGVGMRGVWFDWEHMSYPADAPQPLARIAHLNELLHLLPGPDRPVENVRP
jgi:HAD superfamily hydrolase (TIGR01549 family)